MRRALAPLLVVILQLAVILSGCVKSVPVLIQADLYVSATGDCRALAKSVACADLGPQLRTLNAVDDCEVDIHLSNEAPAEAAEAAIFSVQRAGFRRIKLQDDADNGQRGT